MRNKEQQILWDQGLKKCTRCLTTLPFDKFYSIKGFPFSKCFECCTIIGKERNQKLKEERGFIPKVKPPKVPKEPKVKVPKEPKPPKVKKEPKVKVPKEPKVKVPKEPKVKVPKEPKVKVPKEPKPPKVKKEYVYSEQRLLKNEGKKKCNLCKKVYTFDNFPRNDRMNNGKLCITYKAYCKHCVAPKQTSYKKYISPTNRLPTKTNHYLSNNDLYYELVVSKALGNLTRKAQNMLIIIAKSAIKKMNYNDPQDREDCLSSAYLDIFSNWYNFNEYNTNPFSYFSEVCKRGYAKSWNQLKKRKGLEGYTKDVSLDRGNDGKGFYHSI